MITNSQNVNLLKFYNINPKTQADPSEFIVTQDNFWSHSLFVILVCGNLVLNVIFLSIVEHLFC